VNKADADSPYLEPYREAVELRGSGFEALLWRSREFQERRFQTIVEMAPPSGRVCADLGCGRADLLSWMEREGVSRGRYVGVEGIPELARYCRARIADEKLADAEIIDADFAGDAGVFESLVRDRGVDMMVFSGSLNTFDEKHALRVLDRAWAAFESRTGSVLVFNFLSTFHPPGANPKPRPAHRFNPVRMLDWSLRRTRLTRLCHDYLGGHDATIAMQTS